MNRLELVYLKIDKKKFNTWKSLHKFLTTKAYKGLEVMQKKDGVYHKLQFDHTRGDLI
jgi:hypothetical protein